MPTDTTNIKTSVHSHNDYSYVDNSTHFLQVDNRTVRKDGTEISHLRQIIRSSVLILHYSARGFEILSRRAVLTASYNSSERESAATCLPGTRKEVLNRIYTWADSPSDRNVCLVHGPLGSGKTTVATTLAEKYEKENRLAGTFFFSGDPRDDANRRFVNKVVPTIAYQSSINHPIVKKKIIHVLNSDPTILFKSMETQFHGLVVGPYRRRRLILIRAFTCGFLKVWAAFSFAQTFSDIWIAFVLNTLFPSFTASCRDMTWFVFVVLVAVSVAVATHPTIQMVMQTYLEAFLYPLPMIVVIDAINECRDPLQTLIKTFADNHCESPPLIRFILTSRPEEDILGEFNCYSQRVYSINLVDFSADKDIKLFFEEGLSGLKNKHLVYRGSGNVEEWPSSQDLDLLKKKSEGLFIYAASLLEFVGDCNHVGDPQSRLRHALHQHDGLDFSFRQVLQNAPEFPTPDFHRLLGAISFLYNGLSLGSLAVLLQLHSAADARRLLRGCRSILHIPHTDHENITFFHSSLRDFLTDKNRSQNYAFDRNNYWIDPKRQHLSLLYDCIQLIFAESQNRTIKIEPDRVNYFEASASYAWENWHRHLLDVQLTCRGIIELTRAYFGERYENLFLYFLDSLGDGTLSWPVTWALGCQPIRWQRLEHQLSSLEDSDTELSDRIHRIRKSLETFRFHAMFPNGHNFDIKDCGVNEIWALNYPVEDIYNIGVVIEAEAESGELDPLLDPGKWKEFLSKANMLVAKKNGVNIESENPKNNHSPEPEHQLETPELRKCLIIYTSVDVAPKTLKMPISIIFTLTPPTADPDKPWPAIVWKALHFEQTTTMQTELIWSSRSGFCVAEEHDDGTLQPGDLHAVVKPGYAIILQNVDDGRDMSEQLPMPFKTSRIAISNMTGSPLHLALCSIDPASEVDVFSPVVDLDSVASFGKHVFACKPPVMLQAYAISGYQDHQPVDPSQLRCPLFLNAFSSAPQAIDLRKLNNELTKFQLYSDDTGKAILEMIDDGV